jgi:hypothetical protein
MGDGLEVSAGWLIRKRPSRETVYSCLFAPAPGTSVTGNNAIGGSGRKCRAVGDRSRHQLSFRGDEVEFLAVGPPSRLDTAAGGHLPFAARRRKRLHAISNLPDSFVSYATQRPSEETCPLCSSNDVLTTTIGFRSLPVIGNAHKSRPVFGSVSPYNRNRPSTRPQRPPTPPTCIVRATIIWLCAWKIWTVK